MLRAVVGPDKPYRWHGGEGIEGDHRRELRSARLAAR
jgi:hypothetical protein